MVVDGPHDSSDGKADTIEDREIGMLQVELVVKSLIVEKFVNGFVASANHRQRERSFDRFSSHVPSSFFASRCAR